MRYQPRHLKSRPKRRGPVVVATAASLSIGSSANAATYVVREGDRLSSIAARKGTTVGALVRINRLDDPDLIVAGQRLRIGGGGRAAGAHTVRAGETLSQIAARYGTSVNALARANGLKNPNLIVAGSRLRVPSGGAGRVTRPTPAPTSIAGSLIAHAQAHGVPPALVKAIAWQESGWSQAARSSVGAVGVMQVMPATARWINRYLAAGHNLDVHHADDNIHLGVIYLKHLLDTQSSVPRALAAYYSGPGSLGPRLNAGQKAYVRNVLALMKRF